MRRSLHAALWFLFIAAGAQVHAIEWGSVKNSPAKIEVIGMQPVPLVANMNEKGGWARVPAQFTQNGAVVYTSDKGTDGVADIKVLEDGYLFLACEYDYEGNSQGNWKAEVWDVAKFKAKGWHVMGKSEMDGDLISRDNRKQVVFMKQVHKGDAFRLRCNKYRPPHPILLMGK